MPWRNEDNGFVPARMGDLSRPGSPRGPTTDRPAAAASSAAEPQPKHHDKHEKQDPKQESNGGMIARILHGCRHGRA